MPWPQFILMLNESRRFDAIRMNELCDLHAISICNADFYKLIKNQYRTEIYGPEQLPEKPPMPKVSAIASESVDAQNVLMGMCGALKGGMH